MLKSILALQLAQAFGRALFFVFSIWHINRALGVEAKGVWTALFSLFGILLVCSNMGFEIWLSRAAAAGSVSRGQARRFLFLAKSGWWLLSLAFGAYWAWRSGWSAALALPFGLALVFDGVGVAEQAVFEGKKRTAAMAGMSFMKSGAFALAALAIGVLYPATPLSFFAWLFAAVLLARAALGWRCWRLLPEQAAPLTSDSWRQVAAMGAYTVVTVLYFKVDAVMLSDMAGDRVTGNYGNAYDFVEGALFFSGAAGAVLFPRLVTAGEKGRGPLFDLMFKFVLLAGAAGAAALWLAGPTVGAWLAGAEFAGAEPPLAILALGLPFMFANGVLSRWLFALGREGFALRTAALLALFNIIGNWLLIPEYGAEGAAFMTLATEGVLFFAWTLMGRRSPQLLLFWLALSAALLAVGYTALYLEQVWISVVLAALLLGWPLALYARRVERAR